MLFGGRSDVHICHDVRDAITGCDNVADIIDLCGRTSLHQLVEGLRRCDIVLSVDSAALHIAATLQKPVVGIIGGGHYGRFYPWGDPEKDVSRFLKLGLNDEETELVGRKNAVRLFGLTG